MLGQQPMQRWGGLRYAGVSFSSLSLLVICLVVRACWRIWVPVAPMASSTGSIDAGHALFMSMGQSAVTKLHISFHQGSHQALARSSWAASSQTGGTAAPTHRPSSPPQVSHRPAAPSEHCTAVAFLWDPVRSRGFEAGR